MKWLIPLGIAFFIFVLPSYGRAQTPIAVSTDCVIRNFESTIVTELNASIVITEDLLVDCGNLSNKHGIFRTLPIRSNSPPRKTPINLKSITNFQDVPIPYETITSVQDRTITWKIGDPDKTISGIQEYRIKYSVHNVVVSGEAGDELYWNLSGNFWELPIDHYNASVSFPSDLTAQNTNITLYSGYFGQAANTTGATYEWSDPSTVQVTALTPLQPREGITVRATFPNNIIKAYQVTWFDRYGGYLWFLLIPLVSFISFRVWQNYGKDPKLGYPEVVAFAPPKGISPMEMGLLQTYGGMRNEFLAATLLDLAVRKYLKLEEIPKSGFLGKQDWQITRINQSDTDLKLHEKSLLTSLFPTNEKSDKFPTTKLSDHYNKFYKYIETIRKQAYKELTDKNLIDPQGTRYRSIFIFGLAGLVIVGVASNMLIGFQIPFIISLLVSGLIILTFTILMVRRTKKGAETLHEIEGFQLYIRKAEKYRAQFFEKENIFEQFLPYAILFNLTDRWIKVAKNLLGEEKFAQYHPAWYSSPSAHAFNAQSFTNSMQSVSAAIGSSLTSSPSSSGGGSSGGGGGGGGGGSW